ncbi:hypothetical protein [Raoultibacter massiliensis]|uniref:hypothetical protein n=1 Tax=Raoultibacter massiliensis TaxID=1852371 RepID=UPI003A8D2FBC
MSGAFERATEAEEIGRSARQLAALLFVMGEGIDQDTREQMAVEAAGECAEAVACRMDALAAKLYDAAREGCAR